MRIFKMLLLVQIAVHSENIVLILRYSMIMYILSIFSQHSFLSNTMHQW